MLSNLPPKFGCHFSRPYAKQPSCIKVVSVHFRRATFGWRLRHVPGVSNLLQQAVPGEWRSLDFQEADRGVRLFTLHWRSRFLSKAGARFLAKSCHLATVRRILCLSSSLAKRDYLPINLVDHTQQTTSLRAAGRLDAGPAPLETKKAWSSRKAF